MNARDHLDIHAATLLACLCLIWGLGGVAIKVSNEGMAPLFTAGVRSVIATLCLLFWMRLKGMGLFPAAALDGLVLGGLFGAEFCFLYSSLLYTSASSAWILLYTTPFFHAVGAHYLLKGDRLSLNKVAGLVLAFAGIVFLLSKHASLPSKSELVGDLLALFAAFFWAATTIYIKRRLVEKVSHFHTLFYQTIFSIPVLFAASLLMGEIPVRSLTPLILISIGYQGIIVAFITYLLSGFSWCTLIL